MINNLGNESIVISSHGHILYHHNDVYEWDYFIHSHINPVSVNAEQVFVLGGDTFVLSKENNVLVFKSGNYYLKINEKEELKEKTTDFNKSEKFFLVDKKFYDFFSESFRGFWMNAEEDCIGPEGIRFGHGNKIKFGRYNLSPEDVINSHGKKIVFSDGNCYQRIDGLPPVRIHIHPMGNTANRAMQYLVAKKMEETVSDVSIENIYLPEWGIDTRCEKRSMSRSCSLGWNRYWIDVDGFADCLERRVINTLLLDAFCFNIDHFPKRETSREILRNLATGNEVIKGFGLDEIVFNIRGGEVLEKVQKDYIVLPKEYYQMIINNSGLKPVFFGQIGDNAYSQYLKDAFPDARFVEGRGAIHDFEVIRQSANIGIAVSTFSWLAAWLSHAQRIYMPIAGMYNPNQMKLQNFLPIGESCYQFVAMPYMEAENLYKNTDLFFEKLNSCSRYMKFINHDEAKEILTRSQNKWPSQPIVKGFDSEYYLQQNKVIDSRLYINELSALQNYLHIGCRQNLAPQYFDPDFYIIQYPDAAFEVGMGYFVDLFEHYLKKGQYLGYLASKEGAYSFSS